MKEPKITERKVLRILNHLEKVSKNDTGFNPYQNEVLFLNGVFYATDGIIIISFEQDVKEILYTPNEYKSVCIAGDDVYLRESETSYRLTQRRKNVFKELFEQKSSKSPVFSSLNAKELRMILYPYQLATCPVSLMNLEKGIMLHGHGANFNIEAVMMGIR